MACFAGCQAEGTRHSELASVSRSPSGQPSPSHSSTSHHAPSGADAPTTETSPPSPPPPPTEPSPPNFKELFPGIRVDVARMTVEFDGEIAIDCHNRQTPRVYLEVLVCTPDTREHESIIVTRAKPSLVHAALLAVGFKDGKPGAWEWDEAGKKLIPIPPTGDPLRVDLIVSGVARNIAEYATRADTGMALAASAPDQARSGFLFAGSSMRTRGGAERYEADVAGTLVGLTTFGTETIGWSRMYSPDSSVEEPAWIANAALVPTRGERVVVRMSPGVRPQD